MKKPIMLIVVVAILVIGGVIWYRYTRQTSALPTARPVETNTQVGSSTESGYTQSGNIPSSEETLIDTNTDAWQEYNGSGFSLKIPIEWNITVSSGIYTFSNGVMGVDVAPHACTTNDAASGSDISVVCADDFTITAHMHPNDPTIDWDTTILQSILASFHTT